MAVSMELMEAYVKLSVQGEDKVAQVLGDQKLQVDRLMAAINSGSFEKHVKQQQLVAQAHERAAAAAQKIVNRNLPVIDALPGEKSSGGAFAAMKALWGRGGQQAAGALAGGSVMGAMQGVGGMLGGPAGIAITAANQALELVGKVFDTIEGAMHKIAGLAAAANPMVYERFQYIMRDLNAVIGQMFVPILERVNMVLRGVADVLVNILPSQEEMEQVMRELDPVIEDLKETFMELAPIIKNEVITYLKGAAFALKMLADQAKGFLSLVRLLNPLSGMSGGQRRSSAGMGQFGTPSFMDIAKAQEQFQMAALRTSMGGRLEKTVEERQLDVLEQCAKFLGQLVDKTVGVVEKGGAAAGTALDVMTFGASRLVTR